MREIIFRGKRNDNGEWIIGGYYHGEVYNFDEIDIHYIIPCCDLYDEDLAPVDVIPETVGQYTGLTDKNGKRIYEGDIVFTKTTSCNFVGCILYSTEYVRFVCVTKSKTSYPMDSKFEYEIIGNIHDNKEILNVK